MLYSYPLTIPANTAQAAPATLRAPLAPGTIAQVSIQFPKGCVGLVHVQVLDSTHQVWPANIDEALSSDNYVISWPENYQLDDEPYELQLRGWNDDDTYPHTITFWIAVRAGASPAVRGGVSGLLDRLRAATGGG